MKKLVSWFIISSATFLLGLGTFVLFYFSSIPEISKLELLPAQEKPKCVNSRSFPGLSRKVSEIKKGKSGYFPKDEFAGAWENRDAFINDWYGKHLKAMGEKSLLDISDKNTEVYRFLWLRTFNHPVFVRVEYRQNEIKLFTKELDGAGGYKLGKVLRSNKIVLREKEFCEFLSLLEKANYWNLQTSYDLRGEDGAEWILEAVKNNRYHIIQRWSPDKGEFREACIYLLKLSGVDVDRLKDDLY